MWPSHAYILKPLTDHSGLKKHAPIPWTPDMQTAFDKLHTLIVADTLTAYPDHNKWFGVYTDASDYQLGAFIKADQSHTFPYVLEVTAKLHADEKEMLSIIARLNKFQSMLLGSDIHGFSYHKNLTFDTLKMQ
ncbi:LOW QUALITY PROTEIN: hypothetical protein ACHAW6_007337 [Cyclotella cf. meneghiniana]